MLVAPRVALVSFPCVLREETKHLRTERFLWKDVATGALTTLFDGPVTSLCTFVSR